MPYHKNTKIVLKTSDLMCSILTLDPYNKIFKKVNFKGELNFHATNKTVLTSLCKTDLATEFYELLNTSALRQMAYTIIKTTVLPGHTPHKTNMVCDQPKILKQYLNKFSYFHSRYFSNSSCGGLTAEKENRDKNSLALQALFLIVGV